MPLTFYWAKHYFPGGQSGLNDKRVLFLTGILDLMVEVQTAIGKRLAILCIHNYH